ncbi:hypothetical protein FACS189414_4730 [Bacteroidia bacterium]|nr:hypothetical protein FACS189414_4730 [Bacteroidia bacterium]
MERSCWFGDILPSFKLERIKPLPCIVERNKKEKVFLPERIISQGLIKNKPNKLTGLPPQSLHITISIEGFAHRRVVARAVYSAFVEPLADFEEDEIFILHKQQSVHKYQRQPVCRYLKRTYSTKHKIGLDDSL